VSIDAALDEPQKVVGAVVHPLAHDAERFLDREPVPRESSQGAGQAGERPRMSDRDAHTRNRRPIALGLTWVRMPPSAKNTW
jgi:hypothetical protein